MVSDSSEGRSVPPAPERAGGETTSIHATSDAGPSPVRNLSLSSSGSSAALHASWEQASGQRDSYHLALYHGDSQTLVRNVSVLPNASTFLFDGLLAGSEYTLKVSTLAGPSQASTSIHQWTGREGLVWQEGCSACAVWAGNWIPGSGWASCVGWGAAGGFLHCCCVLREAERATRATSVAGPYISILPRRTPQLGFLHSVAPREKGSPSKRLWLVGAAGTLHYPGCCRLKISGGTSGAPQPTWEGTRETQPSSDPCQTLRVVGDLSVAGRRVVGTPCSPVHCRISLLSPQHPPSPPS